MAIKATLSTTFVDTPEDVYNAKAYAEKAAASQDASKTSETNAATAANAAKTSETNATASATAAQMSEVNAAASSTAAASSQTAAKTSEANAASAESNAKAYATSASNSATAAENSAKKLTYATSDEAKAGTAIDRIISPNTLKVVIDAAIATAKTDIEKQAKLDAHPVGSYYFSDDPTDPADLFGGKWKALPAGYTLIAQGSGTDDFGSFSYTAGQKYGERMHKLTVDELAAHTHPFTLDSPATGSSVSSGSWFVDAGTLGNKQNSSLGRKTDSTGGSQAHNNMPLSIATYGWKRIN